MWEIFFTLCGLVANLVSVSSLMTASILTSRLGLSSRKISWHRREWFMRGPGKSDLSYVKSDICLSFFHFSSLLQMHHRANSRNGLLVVLLTRWMACISVLYGHRLSPYTMVYLKGLFMSAGWYSQVIVYYTISSLTGQFLYGLTNKLQHALSPHGLFPRWSWALGKIWSCLSIINSFFPFLSV